MDKISGYQFVLGFRVWKARAGFLYPISEYGLSAAWPRELPFKANCPFGRCEQRTATRGCTCGFHAFNDFSTANWAKTYYSGNVVGAVLGWGQVQFHKDGFRAEYARPIALISEMFSASYKANLKNGNYFKRRLYKFYTAGVSGGQEVGLRYGVPILSANDFDVYFNQLYEKNRIFIPCRQNIMGAQVKAENFIWNSLVMQRYEVYNLKFSYSYNSYFVS